MLIEIFYSVIEAILLIIKEMGYLGIFIGMAIESSIFPLPSEIILIPAGVLIAKGEMNFFLVLFLAILGSLLGALFNYALAFFIGRKSVDFFIDKYGKFLFLNKEKIKKTEAYFEKHGEITTFIGRLIPFVRHIISLPAGFARMNLWRFSLFTCLGAGIWASILIFTGMFFGSDIDPIIKMIIAITLITSTLIFVAYYMLWNKFKNKFSNIKNKKKMHSTS